MTIFFPTLAGVAFSHNPFRWTSKIRREDGFLRLVWGLGTRAVDRVSNDYPRMVALSHPDLRPEVGAAEIKRYSQHFADVINLAENEFQTSARDRSAEHGLSVGPAAGLGGPGRLSAATPGLRSQRVTPRPGPDL